jgi:hypothetical protein
MNPGIPSRRLNSTKEVFGCRGQTLRPCLLGLFAALAFEPAKLSAWSQGLGNIESIPYQNAFDLLWACCAAQWGVCKHSNKRLGEMVLDSPIEVESVGQCAFAAERDAPLPLVVFTVVFDAVSVDSLLALDQVPTIE